MQCYDVALWLTPFSWWLDFVAFVYAEAASLAVVQLMRTHIQCGYPRLFHGTCGEVVTSSAYRIYTASFVHVVESFSTIFACVYPLDK
jgi:hypothetical protein